MQQTIETIFKEGWTGSLMIFTLVLSYKLYRLRCDSHSDGTCCKWLRFKMNTTNPGGNENIEIVDRINNI